MHIRPALKGLIFSNQFQCYIFWRSFISKMWLSDELSMFEVRHFDIWNSSDEWIQNYALCILLYVFHINADTGLITFHISNALVQITAWRRPGNKPLSESTIHLAYSGPTLRQHWTDWAPCYSGVNSAVYSISNAHCYISISFALISYGFVNFLNQYSHNVLTHILQGYFTIIIHVSIIWLPEAQRSNLEGYG